MKLIKARVTNYKSIDDSGWVDFDDVSCLVGKNESGKTAFVQALYKLSPIDDATGNFDITMDYPRKGLAKYKHTHETSPASVVSAEYELSKEEVRQIEAEFGEGVMKSNSFTMTKNYKNARTCTIQINEEVAVKHFLNSRAIAPETKTRIEKARTCKELLALLEQAREGSPEAIDPLIADFKQVSEPSVIQNVINRHIVEYMPRFVYFDQYSIMSGTASIQYLKSRRDSDQLDPSEKTLLSLLSVAGTSLEQFEDQSNYESLKAELEAASIAITDDVFKFWSQNTQLEVEFDISPPNPNDKPPLNSGTILHIRIKNNRHRVSVPFDERSKGFVWFFSFLAYFSQLENEEYDLILLLDEPGLSLHAKAQYDFLRFIDERLSPEYQVVYTTHSPFMVDPSKLQRVRTVQDMPDKGTVISGDVLRNDRDTIFPLQAALGYDLAQTLFVGPHCLLVEGPSDLIYLQILSEACVAEGKERLDPRWVIVPVGGADKVSTFVSLLGANRLDIAVLMDISSKDMQRIKNLQTNGFLGSSSLIDIGSVIGAKDADIEDLFDPKLYIKLVNGAYASDLHTPLKLSDLTDPNPRIIKRIESHFKQNGIAGGQFSHYRPAVHLLQKQKELLKSMNNTVANASTLFERVNSLLPK